MMSEMLEEVGKDKEAWTCAFWAWALNSLVWLLSLSVILREFTHVNRETADFSLFLIAAVFTYTLTLFYKSRLSRPWIVYIISLLTHCQQFVTVSEWVLPQQQWRDSLIDSLQCGLELIPFISYFLVKVFFGLFFKSSWFSFFFFLDSQFLVCFEKRPYSVLPAEIKLSSFPLEPPKSVNYKCVPPCLGLLLLFLMEVMPQFAFSNIF